MSFVCTEGWFSAVATARLWRIFFGFLCFGPAPVKFARFGPSRDLLVWRKLKSADRIGFAFSWVSLQVHCILAGRFLLPQLIFRANRSQKNLLSFIEFSWILWHSGRSDLAFCYMIFDLGFFRHCHALQPATLADTSRVWMWQTWPICYEQLATLKYWWIARTV